MTLNLPPGSVVVTSVTHYPASLTGSGVETVSVTYTITVDNSAVASVKTALASAISNGAITNTFMLFGYPDVTATKAASYLDRSPTSVPTAYPVYSVNTASCFAGTETVLLKSGETRAIHEIEVGDFILAGNTHGQTTFSEVIYIPHVVNKQKTIFVQITSESGRDVKMTRNHILPAGLCGSANLPLVYASQVASGDCIHTVSGEERVHKINHVYGEGVYTIVTNEEFVVVNGIIASPFGANHMMANLFYNVHRFVYSISPALLASSVLQAANERLGLVIPLFSRM